MRAMVEQQCQFVECGAAFVVRKAEIDRGHGRFCSATCSMFARPKILKHKKAPNAQARNIWIWRNNGALPICRVCAKKADIHHVDGNAANNDPLNHDRLCRTHHISLENTIKPKRKRRLLLTHVETISDPSSNLGVSTGRTRSNNFLTEVADWPLGVASGNERISTGYVPNVTRHQVDDYLNSVNSKGQRQTSDHGRSSVAVV